MRIKKVKFDGHQMYIEYAKKRRDGGYDEFTLTSPDMPRPELKDALAALSVNVVNMCEFRGGDVEVRGVTFTWAKDIMGCVITALKSIEIANSPLVINTPHMTAKSYGKAGNKDDPPDTGSVLPKSIVPKLEKLIDATERYVKGSRAQGSLLEDTD